MRSKMKPAAVYGRWMMVLLLAVVAALLPNAARAQSPLDGFNPGMGPSEPVHAMAMQADGKILIGGQFTQVDGRPHIGVARLNANGTFDTSFLAETNATVTSLYVQRDGKILVGGGFTEIAGQARPGFARLNPDGTLDTAFDVQMEGGGVFAILEQPDGKFVISGFFAKVGGQPRSCIARIEPDGRLDATFNPGWGANSFVVALARQLDGKIVIGGQFYWFDGQVRQNLARLNPDGSLDTDFDPEPDGPVYALAVSHGNIFVGGSFNTIAQTPRTGIALLSPYGKPYGIFASPVPDVHAIALYPDGRVLLGGDFRDYNGEPRDHLVRLDPYGSLDTAFNPGTDDQVRTLLVQRDGRILLGGRFTTVAGQPSRCIARLMPDGVPEPSGFAPAFSSSLFNTVNALAVQPDGKVLIGGNFGSVGNKARSNLARVLSDGRLDVGFNVWLNRSVSSIVVQPDGKILIGGGFWEVQGGTFNTGVARLNPDGSLDPTFVAGGNMTARSLALQPDGKIVVFGAAFLDGRQLLARLNADGSLDTTFDPGTLHWYSHSALTVQPDGKILASAQFQQADGNWRITLVRLNPDGSLDASFNPKLDGNLSTHALQPDGKILVSGYFGAVDGTPRPGFARLNPDGTLDEGFSPSQGFAVYTIALQADGKILTGTLARIRRFNFDGSLDGSFVPSLPYDAQIYTLTVQPDGRVLVGGQFTSIGGVTRINVARLTNDGGIVLDDVFIPQTGNTVFWQKGGAGPELSWVTFEISTDGITYRPLGTGTRVPGGWRLNGLSLPRWLWFSIRARGVYTSGQQSSGSIDETLGDTVLTD